MLVHVKIQARQEMCVTFVFANLFTVWSLILRRVKEND